MSQFSYELIRSDRRTLSLQITPQGKILVRCPNRMPKEEVERFLEAKHQWLSAHLEKIHAQPPAPQLTEAQLQELVRQAKLRIPERLSHYAPLVGVTYGRTTLRMQKTRWGSCSARGNLNFNVLLMLAPPEVLDYVVVHELCHRKEMNHSAAFWAQVERVLPDYRLRRQWLRDHGNALMLRGFGEAAT